LENVGNCWKKTKYVYFYNCPHLNKHSNERVLLSLLTNYPYGTKVFFSCIAAELGRAPAVVKVTLQVNRRTEFSGSHPAKTTAGIKMKCGIIDYVKEETPHAKVGSSRITGGVSHVGDMYQFGVLPITFLRNRFI